MDIIEMCGMGPRPSAAENDARVLTAVASATCCSSYHLFRTAKDPLLVIWMGHKTSIRESFPKKKVVTKDRKNSQDASPLWLGIEECQALLSVVALTKLP
ncbi:hypothetical protein R1flu_019350 [Riccia fluitans]|uniref:Uncharacterized protein n=1 Tax=Riccia fluitans TaxID=41844 RepID=A0ABD1ZIR7_9MARC